MDGNEKLSELTLPDPLIMNDGKRVACKSDVLHRCEEIKELLQNEIYGKMPPPPDHLGVSVKEIDKSFAAGKAHIYTLDFSVSFGNDTAHFAVKSVIPAGKERVPAIICISDTEDIPSRFLPAEEIIDRGYAIFVLPHRQITSLGKGARFHDGLAAYLRGGARTAYTPGKLMMWAWGAMRVMDYAVTESFIDKDNVSVCGHGIFGISALIAGGFDKRFKYVIANCAESHGTALRRDAILSTHVSLHENYPELFSKKFIKSARSPDKRDYKRHFLLFLSLDRHLLIGSAKDGVTEKYQSELLTVASLSPAISILLGEKVSLSPTPSSCKSVTLGRVFYHLRDGCEYFSRYDWNTYLDYIDKNL